MTAKLSFENWKKQQPVIDITSPETRHTLEQANGVPAAQAVEKILRERYNAYVRNSK
jgi:hypothetical protein